MKISERALGYADPLSEKDWPLSEQYRVVAKAWCDLDGAARMLESMRDPVLSEMVGRLVAAGMSVARAEREAKGSAEFHDYTRKSVEARTQANLKRHQLEFIRMRHSEWISGDANARAEKRL